MRGVRFHVSGSGVKIGIRHGKFRVGYMVGSGWWVLCECVMK